MFLERGRLCGFLDSHTLNRFHQSNHLDRSFRPQTWLDESGVNIQGLTSRIPPHKGLRTFTPQTWLDESDVNMQRLISRIPPYKGLRAYTTRDNQDQSYPFPELYFVYLI